MGGPRDLKATQEPERTETRPEPSRSQLRPAAPRGAADLLELQRSIGNRAVCRLVAGALVQPKRQVGPADGNFERESDQVADDVIGQYQPHTNAGQRLLAHELTHPIQQAPDKSGRQVGRSPSERPNPCPSTVQRILTNAVTGQYVSTCDKATVIDAAHAAITVAATKDELTGGHAEIYLEMFENGAPVEYSLDMFGVNDSKMRVRTKQYPPGGLNLRSRGGSKTYSISTAQADQALVKAAELKVEGENGTIKYEYYVPKMWNLNPFGAVTYMNCADFAESVLIAAGVAVSAGIFSIPKTVAN